VLFVDQSDVGLYPKVGSGWGPSGEQDKVRTQGKNQKTYLFGALDAHSGELHVGFWPRKDSVAFVDFLRGLLAAIPDGEIHLVLDNYIVHKSRYTRAFLATEEARRVHLHFLPTYSPWLNPIEITWRIVKSRAGTNQWRDSLECVHADFHETLAHLGAILMAPSPYYAQSQGTT
jgi:putative transposase